MSRRGLPADVAHLPRARRAVFAIGLGRVVVVAALGGPIGLDVRIERPVGKVNALDGIRQRTPLEGARREPKPAVPRSDSIAGRALRDLEWKHALGAKGALGLVVRNELRRSAELAVLRLPSGIEDGDRVTALAAYLAPGRLPSALIVGDAAQRSDEVVLDDRATGGERHRRFGPAEWADHFLLRRIPDRLAAAGGTCEFRLGGD